VVTLYFSKGFLKVAAEVLVTTEVLWQPLDQCPIAAQAVNLTRGISSGNTSCVFIRELNREPQQYSTDYLYKVPWSVL